MSFKEDVLSKAQNVEYVSFDVYDTLLLRFTSQPQRLFRKMFENSPGLFPHHITAVEWEDIRFQAENKARMETKKEITLDQIYNALPQIIKNSEQIKQLELQCEKDYSFINQEIAEIIYELKDIYKKKILLISDMYLSCDVILEILSTNGFKIEYIDKCFVSCDIGLKKFTGEMYKYVIGELGCSPNQILHIGDNFFTDFKNALKTGCNAIHYPLISDAEINFPYLTVEGELYDSPCDELYSLRLLAAATVSESYNDEEIFWYQLGAMVLGPLLTFTTKWVMDTAEENNIKLILPIMREGKFLSELLENEKKFRNWDGIIELMYLSRKALYPALLCIIEKKDIVCNMITQKKTVEQFFELFEDKTAIEKFSDYKDCLITEIGSISFGSGTLYDEICKYVYSEDYIAGLHKRFIDADLLIYGYFKQLGITENDFITFDVGWGGTIQNAIQRLMKKNNAISKGINLLMCGKEGILLYDNLSHGCDIRGFLGNFGINRKKYKSINVCILEMFMMCDEGTTIGYTKDDTRYKPLIKNINYNEKQLKMMRILQNGIFSFQGKINALKEHQRNNLCAKTDELMKIVERMMLHPTYSEAMYIGDMEYDQNFGVDEKWKTIDPKGASDYSEIGFRDYLVNRQFREIEWLQGIETVNDPFRSLDAIFTYKKNKYADLPYLVGDVYISLYDYVLLAKKVAKASRTFALFGVGFFFRHLLSILKMASLTNKIDIVMDNNTLIQGLSVCGYKIQPLGAKTDARDFVITVSNITAYKSILADIKNIYGNDVNVFSIHNL